MTYDLRQQLSSDSLALLERAADAELARLEKLHWEFAAVTHDPAIFQAVARQVKAMQNAKLQLRYAFIDQFEQGRAENDSAGRVGLVAE